MKPASKPVWVIIPACNEQRHIGPVITAAKRFAGNVVVVDDGSRDRTSEIAKSKGAVVLRHVINLGKGNALKTGCDYALRQGAERIVAIDGDGQHRAGQIPQFLRALRGKDIVFGYRTFNSKMPFLFRVGNTIIGHVSKILFGIELRDTQCGYRAFTAAAYKKVRWDSGDYRMESEMVMRAARHKLRYSELAVDTIYADRYKGTTLMDGVKITFNLLWWKLTKR
jgi:glycosyltransferase involved in cell wall biosynthesis